MRSAMLDIRVKLTPDVQLFRTYDGVQFGVEICEDVWARLLLATSLALAGADLIFNLSARDELIGKHQLSEESAQPAECPHHDGLYLQFLWFCVVPRMWYMVAMP